MSFFKLLYRSLLLILILLSGGSTFAAGSTGTNIRITVRGLEDKPMILAYYYGDKQYIKDSVKLDKKASHLIKADTVWPSGIYLAVFPSMGNRYFEFILNEPQFSLETDTLELSMNMKITGSVENRLFYDDLKFLSSKRRESEPITAKFRAEKDEKAKENLRQQLIKIDEEVKASRLKIIQEYPKTFYAVLLNAMKEIDVPQPPKDAMGNLLDSAFSWKYYKSHYWNTVDLRNDNLIRTPVFHNKLKTYFSQTTVQVPDSLIVTCEELLRKVTPRGELFKYMLVYFLNEMAKSKYMGMDAVYVHLVKNYYAKGYATWVDSVQLFKIVERGNILEPLLIGKRAKNMVLADTTLKKFYGLHDVKAKYTILTFWDPDCGHCKKEIPKLYESYDKLKAFGAEVYAVATMPVEEVGKWTDFINQHKLNWINVADPYHRSNFRFEYDIQSTPQIYVLDQDKKIVAKRIAAEQVEDFVHHLADPSYKPNTLYQEQKEEEEH